MGAIKNALEPAIVPAVEPSGIAARIRSARSAGPQPFNLLVYGAPGAGKTYLAGSAADAGHKVLLVDVEAGSMTVRDTAVDVLSVRQWSEVQDVYRFLADGGHGYDTVVLDSLTELQKMHAARLKANSGGSLKIAQWGEVIDGTRQLVRAFRDLGLNTVVLCLSKEVEDVTDDGSNRLLQRPDLHGKSLPAELAGFFDLVGYAHIGKGEDGQPEHRICFRSATGRVIAKDRSGKLNDVEPNDWATIYAKVQGRPDQAQHPDQE